MRAERCTAALRRSGGTAALRRHVPHVVTAHFPATAGSDQPSAPDPAGGVQGRPSMRLPRPAQAKFIRVAAA